MSRTKLDSILNEIRIVRQQVLQELNDFTEDEFDLAIDTQPWLWKTGLRVLLQFGNHMREHSNQIRGARQDIGRSPTQPQRSLGEAEIAWGYLLAAVTGLQDEDLDVLPHDGGWSVAQTLSHILESEKMYLEAIQTAQIKRNSSLEK